MNYKHCCLWFRRTVLLLAAVSLCCACSSDTGRVRRFTASVYPVYCMLLNLTRDAEGVSVACLSTISSGCAHDYQITTADRRRLADSDLIAYNGAGLEPYLNPLLPSLVGRAVDLSVGIDLILSKSEHGGIGLNPHIWVSIPRAILQMNTLADALKVADPKQADIYESNRATAERSMMELYEKMRATLAPYAGARIATFHPAFDYFAEDFGLTVAVSLTDDPESPPSARELANAIQAIKDNPVKALFVGPGDAASSAVVVHNETGVPIYELNPASYPIEGIPDTAAYSAAMERNLAVLLEALGGDPL